MGDMNNCKSK